MTDTAGNNRDIANRALEAWADRNEDAVEGLFHEDFKMRSMAGGRQIEGKDGLRQVWGAEANVAPALRLNVEEQIEQGNVVVTRWTASSDGDPDDNTVQLSGTTTMRIDDGRIRESWTHADDLGAAAVVQPDAVLSTYAAAPALVQDC